MFKLQENAFANQEIESKHFYSCPQQNSPPGSYNHPHTEKIYFAPPRLLFFFWKSVPLQ